MVKLFLFRGAPAVGKTTITKKILQILKKEHKIDCAYICEDDFRKQMQFKYKAKDNIAHLNSFELIKTVILKLLQLDSYSMIFIEGQFRYKKVIDKYEKFAKDKKFDMKIFQLNLDIKEMVNRDKKLRNTKSKDILEVKKDIDSYIPDYAVKIETKKSIEDSIKKILKYIL